jgi:DnaK suppressor protein
MDPMEDIAKMLRDKRAELGAELERMSAPPTERSAISFGKRVGEGTSIAIDRMVQVEAHGKLQETLADTDRALGKLEEGSYGRCDACGTDIPAERLEALPWAVLCVSCASKR